MALNFFGVMLLAPGMAWGTLRERPVPLEVLEPDAWASGDDGLGESIPPAAPRAPRPAPTTPHFTRVPTSHEWCALAQMSVFPVSGIQDNPKSETPLSAASGAT